MSVDEDGFKKEMLEQKTRSKDAEAARRCAPPLAFPFAPAQPRGVVGSHLGFERYHTYLVFFTSC